ncbi:alanine racemase [soil metagenome]
MSGRWAWAEIDPDAVAHNVTLLRGVVAPAAVWAVVKADGYGHGAVPVARAALVAGATGLCVALVQEGDELRRAGIEAPILLLSEQPPEQARDIVEHRLTPTVYTLDAVRALDAAARTARSPMGVHVKVDTGMQRVGARPDAVLEVIDAVLAARGSLRLAGVDTHLAVADDPDDPMTAEQLRRFDHLLEQVASRALAAGLDPDDLIVHAANSAGGLAHAAARRSVVRAGIAVYGISPGHGVDHLVTGLRPAMRLVARVSFVKRVEAGSRISYGLRHTFERSTTVATVPLGYADGVPRRLSSVGGEVLVGGRRCPIVGVVTMDQLMVDVGNAEVMAGDEVVLLGRQGSEEVRAEEWADRLDTIGYEIVCGISRRIERVLTGRGGGSAASGARTAGT